MQFHRLFPEKGGGGDIIKCVFTKLSSLNTLIINACALVLLLCSSSKLINASCALLRLLSLSSIKRATLHIHASCSLAPSALNICP